MKKKETMEMDQWAEEQLRGYLPEGTTIYWFDRQLMAMIYLDCACMQRYADQPDMLHPSEFAPYSYSWIV